MASSILSPHPPIPHHGLKLAEDIREIAVSVLDSIGDVIIQEFAPEFLSTIALNLWSPYLSRGRFTKLTYPQNNKGDSIASDLPGDVSRLDQLHRHYFAVFGRNTSPNRILYETRSPRAASELIINAHATRLQGPFIIDNDALHAAFSVPPPDQLRALEILPSDYETLLEKFLGDEFGRFKYLLRDALAESRNRLRRLREETGGHIREAFAEHLREWITRGYLSPAGNLSEYYDQWLARIQMTAFASSIWGAIWVSRRLDGLGIPPKLHFTVTLTVTGKQRGSISDDFQQQVSNFTDKCQKLITERIQEQIAINKDQLERFNPDAPLTPVDDVSDEFAGVLGRELIGTDHEGKKLHLTGLLTEGLDALDIGPAEIRVVYEIPDESEEAEGGENKDRDDEISWKLHEALFKSNAYFLDRERMALHFELYRSSKGTITARPLHVVELVTPLRTLLDRVTDPPFGGLIRQGFEVDVKRALHVRSTAQVGDGNSRTELAVQQPRAQFAWKGRTGDTWDTVAQQIRDVLDRVADTSLGQADFFTAASAVIRALVPEQREQLANGVAEVRRIHRGCLVFLGPLRKCFAQRERPNGSLIDEWDGLITFRRGSQVASDLEIARLGPCFDMVSEVPASYAHDFCTGFADLAGMDGETVICAVPEGYEQRVDVPSGRFWKHPPNGAIYGRRFVQLPPDTPALIDPRSSRVAEPYRHSWQSARYSVVPMTAPPDSVVAKNVKEVDLEDLLSFGTRHRKAAMATMACKDLVAITCSSSGPIRVWVGGIPVVALDPKDDMLLPDAPRLNTRHNR